MTEKGDEDYHRYAQLLEERGYEKTDLEDPNFEIWGSDDTEVQLFYQSGQYHPRARSKRDHTPINFNNLVVE